MEGRSNRIITDTVAAFQKLISAGYEETMLYTKKPLGLTELEKLCGGKKQLTDLIGDMIQKPTGKPTLAPESDRRKPFAKTKLKEMFGGN